MDRREKLSLIAALLMGKYNGKLKPRLAVRCARYYLKAAEAEVYRRCKKKPRR